jgi:hypothetical protein
MRHTALRLMIAIVFAIFSISIISFEANSATTENATTKITTEKVTKKATSQKVVLKDSFKKAYDNFVKKDTKTAAADVRKNAEFMRLMSEHTANASREALTTSAKELDTLANEIENGTVTSAKTLGNAFANANIALAKHYSLKISESLASKDEKKAGKDFKAAANYLDASFEWAEIEQDKGAAAVIKSAQEIAKKTAKGAKLAESETSKVISDLNAEIEKVSAKLTIPTNAKTTTTTKVKETTKTTKIESVKKPVGVK